MSKPKSFTKGTANTNSRNPSVLGVYEGESLDSNITNKNGLDITREVIEAVLDSEEYAQGIENGWFIGFLGHPEDPNCMEFKYGCIVMTDMWIEDNGKVYAKFNLINTPVGEIVKTYIDAGVKFGISIRGAGDIINNSVEPEGFVFRGFDLVSFPAYPESIPEFTSVAASTNLEERKKYQAVCAAVKSNISSIHSCTEIDILKSAFAPQSEGYKLLENRRKEIQCKETLNIDSEKIEAMTNLYLDASNEVHNLAVQVEKMKQKSSATISACNRKVAALKRITSAQLSDVTKELDSTARSLNSTITSCTALRSKNRSLSKSCNFLRSENSDLVNQLNAMQKTNLIYKQRVKASANEIQNKENVISGLRKKLRETVTASSKVESSASNLGEENKHLKSENQAIRSALRSFQNAYANVYATALGVHIDSISISDSTSVAELQKIIDGATNTVNIPSTSMVEPAFISDEDDDYDLVTV